MTSFSQTVDYLAKSETHKITEWLGLEETSADHLFNPLLKQVPLCIPPEKSIVPSSLTPALKIFLCIDKILLSLLLAKQPLLIRDAPIPLITFTTLH